MLITLSRVFAMMMIVLIALTIGMMQAGQQINPYAALELVVSGGNSQQSVTTYFDAISQTAYRASDLDTNTYFSPEHRRGYRYEITNGKTAIYLSQGMPANEIQLVLLDTQADRVLVLWDFLLDSEMLVVAWRLRDNDSFTIHNVDPHTGHHTLLEEIFYSLPPQTAVRHGERYVLVSRPDFFWLFDLETELTFSDDLYFLNFGFSPAAPYFHYIGAHPQTSMRQGHILDLRDFSRTSLVFPDGSETIDAMWGWSSVTSQLIVRDFERNEWLYDASSQTFTPIPADTEVLRSGQVWSGDGQHLLVEKLLDGERDVAYGVYTPSSGEFMPLFTTIRPRISRPLPVQVILWSSDDRYILASELDYKATQSTYRIYEAQSGALHWQGVIPVPHGAERYSYIRWQSQ